MTCDVCSAQNEIGSKFCINCGNPLTVACPTCSIANSPDARFCRNCGGSLSIDVMPEPAGRSTERRLVTVLFADITDYTPFAEGRDSEEVRGFLEDYFERSRAIVERFGGIVEKFIGDAVMAVWGAETANEDDAERAVRAGFELVEVVAKLSADIGAPDLELRVGIHTGAAAVGPTDDHMSFVTGDLVNTASRLQSAAEPGSVLVGEATHQAASRSIAFEPVGPQSLKGKELPVTAWRATRVVSERGGRGRAEALEPPFVGRGNELRLLKDLLETVGSESRARLVSLVGEAGIGKSRLVWEFLKYIDGLVDDIYWHEGRSPAYGDGVTFWSISEMIKARCGITEDDSSETVARKLDSTLETYVPEPSDRAWIKPRLAAVLGAGETPGDRSELEAAIRAFFEGVSSLGTTVLVFEDLHWADGPLIDFIEDLCDWWRGKPILIVTMARPDLLERRPSWGTGRQGFISVTLGPLGDDDMSTLVHGAVPGLPEHAADAIVRRAAGIPLYAVELLRGLLAQGELAGQAGDYRVAGDLSQMEIPETLQAVIGARLDRLSPEDRALIQEAAVLGQTFTIRALATLTGRERGDLESHLQQLSRRELVEPVRDDRSPERGQYRFLQGLIRDVALGRLSRESRRTRHLAVAEYLEGQDEPELAGIIAGHYLQALDASPSGEPRDLIRGRALSSMAEAATRAADLRSHRQVVTICDTALEIAELDEERVPFWELTVVASGRLADVESAQQHAEKALDFYRRSGDTESIHRLTYVLAQQLADNGMPEQAIDLLEPMLDESQDVEESRAARARALYGRVLLLNRQSGALDQVELSLPALEKHQLIRETVDALITKGTALGQIGRLTEARLILEGSIRLCEEHELGVVLTRALNNLAFTLTGVDDGAVVRISEEAYRIAQRLGDRSHLLFQAGQYAFSLIFNGEFDHAEEVMANPLLADPPPVGLLTLRTQELTIAVWRGQVEEVDRLAAEMRRLVAHVDDPQTQTYLDDLGSQVAIVHGELETAFEAAAVRLEKSPWNEVSDTIGDSMLSAGVLGDRSKFARLALLLEAYEPRFAHHATFARILASADSEISDTRELDAVIAARLAIGSVTDQVRFSLSAAHFVSAEKRIEYLAVARSIAGERGWNGALDLIDRYFD
jgi:class 3 adenylate cyclase/tetratricopeptide (TPR) repeat protein